ncbi:hypothetical protein [Ornithinibacillus halotolerans]|uniref:Uncharacterized protein n=1 Tax=Ornithinibacillus halotolerans TaxID=1274357 RepID=A0A916RTF6_9BACI|nr:hypothetical protein [Ornithinibacillus halotolerans]GGA66509.1 hypothetical protein GCM10008025_07940 [Ornithinibacillus halotolerans]
MKLKRKRRIPLILIVILVVATLVAPINHIFASNPQHPSGNSGGFIIETTKVDGTMDFLGALTGNITIYEGMIHGLTITKVIERGNGLEPLVVRITSPGPIPVKNLNAQTINNELPNIGGLCKPSKLGNICMENVVMNVEEQVVESISLVNANIHTCYLSECGSLPNYNPLISIEQLEELFNDGENSEEELQKIIDLIKEQEDLSEQLEGLLDKATVIVEELLNEEYVSGLYEEITKLEESLLSELGLDQILPDFESVLLAIENISTQLIAVIELLDTGSALIDEIDANISSIERKFAEYEEALEDKEQLMNQFGAYAQLMELAELQKAGSPIEYSVENNDQEEEEKEEVLSNLQVRMLDLINKIDNQKNEHNNLLTKVEELKQEEDTLQKESNGLKELLEELGLGNEKGDDGDVENVLKPVEDIGLDPIIEPVKDNVLDPVKEKVLDPVLDPVQENILDPVTEDVLDPVIDPIKENILDPIEENVLSPILDPITGKLIDPVTGKVIDLIVDPVNEKLIDPITEKVIIPILNPLTGKLINPLTGEVIKHVYNEETGKLLDPYKDSFLKKLIKKLLNPFG